MRSSGSPHASDSADDPQASSATSSPGAAGAETADQAQSATDRDDSDLLAALLDGMDAALCAFDAAGVVTHWNREAERILGWSAVEAIGRRGLADWAVRAADAHDVQSRLFGAMHAPGRQVHEFALLTKDGGRVLVRTQSAAVPGPGGAVVGVYCAFSEVHTQIDLERSIALSEALFEDASWGVVLMDADLRPAVVNRHAARSLRTGRTAPLGRPLGELLDQGIEEVESAFQHVLAEGPPPAPTEIWVTVRGEGADLGQPPTRRCWRSGFLRLASPLAEEPVPLGVAWIFRDVTETKRAEQESARMRFRSNQLHRAARAAAESEDPVEAATVYLDFALAGFADHALIDLVREPSPASHGTSREAADGAGEAGPVAGHEGAGPAAEADAPPTPTVLVRAVAAPAGAATGAGPAIPVGTADGIPVAYPMGHPALQAADRCGSVRASAGRTDEEGSTQWAQARKWPAGTVHGLCAVLRSRGRTLGVASFLRGSNRRAFDRTDAAYAEDVAVRVAAAIDLAQHVR
ncbi:PAS domain S-box-containing protein [Streptomyces zagrosensis]|uniref:PAS domain S-box-containing protein n=2 Tax=Streptomyces zagrosensis TaxID=1042984 RepID=A0A7W9Q6Y3_9ACTN|nr:PAS domain-containing protein [Streptomyces zagrosensis]MBB5934671.1 PAS domain S-box-containing protein [Streptomyces zagrosensis]